MERLNILYFFFFSPCFSSLVTSSVFVYRLAMFSFFILFRKLAFYHTMYIVYIYIINLRKAHSRFSLSEKGNLLIHRAWTGTNISVFLRGQTECLLPHSFPCTAYRRLLVSVFRVWHFLFHIRCVLMVFPHPLKEQYCLTMGNGLWYLHITSQRSLQSQP